MLRRESKVNRQRHKQINNMLANVQDSPNMFNRDDSKRSIKDDETVKGYVQPYNYYPHHNPAI
jgi:hypothetical protein